MWAGGRPCRNVDLWDPADGMIQLLAGQFTGSEIIVTVCSSTMDKLTHTQKKEHHFEEQR